MTRVAAALLALASLLGPASAAERFTVDGTALIYDTEQSGAEGINYKDVARLRELLRANPEVTKLQLNSSGGGYYPAFDMANILVDFDLDTEVLDECSSSCVFVFLGGRNRSMTRGGRIGFHRTYWEPESVEEYYNDVHGDRGWQDPFDFVSWNYEDTQLEVFERLTFMIERGVTAAFSIETLRADSSDMWYPYRIRLIAGGVLTE